MNCGRLAGCPATRTDCPLSCSYPSLCPVARKNRRPGLLIEGWCRHGAGTGRFDQTCAVSSANVGAVNGDAADNCGGV